MGLGGNPSSFNPCAALRLVRLLRFETIGGTAFMCLSFR